MPSSSSSSVTHSSSEDEDAIEMTGFHEVVVTPNPALHDHRSRYPAFDEDEENGLDEGDRELLNPENSKRWEEKEEVSVWAQARNIALEVCGEVLFILPSFNISTVDIAYIIILHSRHYSHRRASRTCVGAFYTRCVKLSSHLPRRLGRR